MTSTKSRILSGPLGVLVVWMACVLPSLDRTRLQDVDELTHARVAQAAALQGQWWPLQLDGRNFYEKPPVLLWLAGATAKFSGRPLEAWPYRAWTCLAAGFSLFFMACLGSLVGAPLAGFLAALALALQGDFIFHARFFTFDTPFLAAVLASLVLSLRAARSQNFWDWCWAGLALAAAAAFKSWFVLALVPAYAVSVGWALPRSGRVRTLAALMVPPLTMLAVWLGLYVYWNGWQFLREEWSANMLGRALGHVNEADPEGHAAFYLKWTSRTAPALLPWVLAVPLGMLPSKRPAHGLAANNSLLNFARIWVWAFCLSWILGLALVRAETINYVLPLEAGLCLALGLELVHGQSLGHRWLQIGLLTASGAAVAKLWDPFWSFGLGALWGLLWFRLERGQGNVLTAGAEIRLRRLVWVFGFGLMGFAVPSAFGLVTKPLDPTRQVADLLLAHPARIGGERLWVIGGATQAIAFYSAYQVRWLGALPTRRPPEATLVETRAGWIFYPAMVSPTGASGVHPGRSL